MTDTDSLSNAEDVDKLATMRTRAEFAQELTALRKALALGIRNIADRTQIPTSAVGGYFSGKHLPAVNQPAYFLSVLEALDVTDPVSSTRWSAATIEPLTSRSVPGCGS